MFQHVPIWHILACRERKAGCLVELYVLPIVAKSDPERVRGRQILYPQKGILVRTAGAVAG